MSSQKVRDEGASLQFDGLRSIPKTGASARERVYFYKNGIPLYSKNVQIKDKILL